MSGTISRRQLLQAGVSGAVLLGAGGLLGACGGASDKSSTSSSAPAGRPRYGGRLRAGLTGSAAVDTLDADNAINNLDFARVIQLYDSLVNISRSGGLELQLAESIEANADATSWTIRLRPGVTFHDGKPLGAEDVLFTFQRILNPKYPLASASSLAPLDLSGAKVLDKLTLRVPCKTPFSTLVPNLADYDVYIVPVGYDPRKPIGTGAFKYKSFTPGVQSVFVRNPDYWVHGEPYVDELVITDYADPTAQLNALLSGEVDYIDQLTSASVPPARSGGDVVVISGGGAFNNIVMRVDKAPFDDNRVRLAMKYIVDRKQMRGLFLGDGLLGNDVPCITDPMYDRALPQREPDIDRARSLLKAAGQQDLHVQLVTAAIGGGVLEQAQIFAEQAKAAGVTVSIDQITPQTFFGPEYLQRTFTQDSWLYGPYFTQVALAMVPGAPYNETHFDDARYNQLFAEALRTTDTAKQTEIAHEMMVIEYETSGNVIPNFTAYFDAHSPRLHGITGSEVGLPSWSYCFKECWFV